MSKFNTEAQVYFDKLAKFCQREDIELIVITTPIPEDTLDEYKDWFRAGDDFFKGYMKERGIPYINYNMDSPYKERVSHAVSDFGDREGHMYGTAADAFSKQLGDLLNGRDKS